MAKITKDLPTYTPHSEVKAFKIASIGANRGGAVLRSSVKDGVAIEINVSGIFIREEKPTIGSYYVVYRDADSSKDTPMIISPDNFESEYTLGAALPVTDNVLTNAKFGYDLWRKANPSAKILKKSPPTAYVLFREKKYSNHADKWIDAAQKL